MNHTNSQREPLPAAFVSSMGHALAMDSALVVLLKGCEPVLTRWTCTAQARPVLFDSSNTGNSPDEGAALTAE